MNIYVGNLAFNTTNHDLRQLFEPYGVVDEIRVITIATRPLQRLGFVEMPDGTAARTAIAKLQGQEVASSMRPSRVNRAVSPVRRAGKLLGGLPVSARRSPDGHPMGWPLWPVPHCLLSPGGRAHDLRSPDLYPAPRRGRGRI